MLIVFPSPFFVHRSVTWLLQNLTIRYLRITPQGGLVTDYNIIYLLKVFPPLQILSCLQILKSPLNLSPSHLFPPQFLLLTPHLSIIYLSSSLWILFWPTHLRRPEKVTRTRVFFHLEERHFLPAHDNSLQSLCYLKQSVNTASHSHFIGPFTQYLPTMHQSFFTFRNLGRIVIGSSERYQNRFKAMGLVQKKGDC